MDEVSFTVNTSVAPVITANPFSQTNYPGYTVALYAAATSNPTATWQWFRVGSGPLAGATNALFMPTNSGTAGVAGSYYATASNVAGAANTTTASVTFVSAPLTSDWAQAFITPLTGNGVSPSTNYNLACVFDSAGNLFTAGSIIGTNTFGSNVLGAPYGYGSSIFLKQTAAGTPIWGVGMTSIGNGYSYVQALAPAPNNGIYALGLFSGTNWLGSNQLVDTAGGSTYLAQISATGNVLWVRAITGTNVNFPTHHALVTDPAGNVTLSGLIWGNTSFNGVTNVYVSGQQGVLLQYDANGNLRWLQTPSSWPDYLVYSAGRIYGTMGGGATNYIGGATNLADRQRVLFSLNATNGSANWLQPFSVASGQHSPDGYGFGDDNVTVAVSGTNVFVVGSAYGTNAQFGPFTVNFPGVIGEFFARYDTSGNPQLVTTFGGPHVWPWAAKADLNGNVYVGCDFDTYAVFGNYVLAAPFYSTVQFSQSINSRIPGQTCLAKFDRNGNALWARSAQSTSAYANCRDITLTPNGAWSCGFFTPIASFGTNTLYGTSVCVGSPNCVTYFQQSGFMARVADSIALPSVITLTNPAVGGGNFQFQFLSQAGLANTVQYRTNLTQGSWLNYSNLTGDGTLKTIPIPLSLFGGSPQGFVRLTNSVSP